MMNRNKKLDEAITLLVNRQQEELDLLKRQFQVVYAGLQPVNLVKSLVQQTVQSPEIRHGVLNNILGITAGFLSKKVVLGNSVNPIKRMIGSFLQYSIATVVAKKLSNAPASESDNA